MGDAVRHLELLPEHIAEAPGDSSGARDEIVITYSPVKGL